ncbi:MAG: LamG-like jellyroll fold domain-containing protein [Chloroflexota bacterium]|nr:LamG-like jellyroll fold domain-containing protein [Chloroflexota bacterium]
MTHKRIFLRTSSLVGLVLGVLILTMITLTSVQTRGSASIAIAKEAGQTMNFGIEIAKTPDSQTVVSGGTATFTIIVTNTGNMTLTNVTVSDVQAPNCAQTVGVLAAGDDHTYVCTVADVTSDFTNSATVTGTTTVSDTVTYTDTAFVDVINPRIEIAKTPDTQTVTSGSDVDFTIAITNTGDVPLTDVTISDAQAPDCNRTYANLSPEEIRRYDCTVTNVTDGFINSATVTGKPPVGEDVTAADAAKVILDETGTCPTGMIAYWRLDELSSGAYDDYYDGHDGECAGECPSPATTGRVNGGQEFNGSDTGINAPAVPGDDSFNWGAQDSFSIEFWMQTDSASTCLGNEVAVGRDDSATDLHWWTGCWNGGQAAFYLGDTGGQAHWVNGTTDLTDGSWHHVVAVREASTNRIRIYVDGIEEASTAATYTDGFDSSTAALNIGWLNLSGQFHFDGILDEVALYDNPLSADDIQQHYNKGLAERWYCQSGTFAPTIVSVPVTNATVGRLYSYDVEAVGNPDPTYALTTYPSGMTIDPATGLISWTPTLAQEGNHAVEVEASNWEGTDHQDFTIFVAEGTLCPADMIAYWKLDESSSGAYDDFYDGHNGACTGLCPTPTTGHINGGQEFGNGDTGINVPADADFDWNATNSFSIEFWMQTDNASTCSGNEVVIGRSDSSSNMRWWAGCWEGGQAAFHLISTGGQEAEVAGTTDLTDGDWHHVVAMRDASTDRIRIYVDGTQENWAPTTYTSGFDSEDDLNIGWFNLSSHFHFDGIVDEIALYDRALSAAEIQQHYNDGEAGPGYCINPDIAVNKTANPMVAYLSDAVIYTYAVTNPGDAPLSDITLNDDKCRPITSPEGDDGNGSLDPDETWTYYCSMTASADITNTATVTGTHFLNNTVSNTDIVFVDVINPGIAIDKTAYPTTIQAGDVVTYTYAVTNPGNDPLSNVQKVSDDKCTPVTLTGGDGNSNYKLDPGEIWTYTCSTTVNTDIVNTATVTGTDSAGGTVSAQDTAFVDVISPDISIVKTADPTVIYAGDTVTYTYIVTNPSANPLSSVGVSDDKCTVVAFVGGDTNSDDLLDAGETWTYRCVTTLDEDTTNTATATGTNSVGDPISPDTDTAFVDVMEELYIYLPLIFRN